MSYFVSSFGETPCSHQATAGYLICSVAFADPHHGSEPPNRSETAAADASFWPSGGGGKDSNLRYSCPYNAHACVALDRSATPPGRDQELNIRLLGTNYGRKGAASAARPTRRSRGLKCWSHGRRATSVVQSLRGAQM